MVSFYKKRTAYKRKKMLSILKNNRTHIYTVLIGLFFILFLQFKASYNVIPALLGLLGLAVIIIRIKHKTFNIQPENKLLVFSLLGYFSLFVLSVILHEGKGRDLDLPSRILLILPILTLLYDQKIKSKWIIYSILIACFLNGLVAMYQVWELKWSNPFPNYHRIQSGDIAMSIALFSLCISFYFYQIKNKLLTFITTLAFSFGFIASILCLSRGSLIGFLLALITLFILYRQLLSKKILIFIILSTIIAGGISYKIAQSRWDRVQGEINQCLTHNKCNTSIGLRLDMYKSALLGIQQKPLLGWGFDGVKEMRKQHANQGLVTKEIVRFNHSHNQYLHDASVRGILGLIALLTIFFIPLALFIKNLKQSHNPLSHLWGRMGIVHIIATIGYCLTQSFLSHHSGNMFYFTTVIIFLCLQKMTLEDKRNDF